VYHIDAERVHGIKTVHLIFICVFLLLGIGLVTLYSASYPFAARFKMNGNFFIIRQLILAGIGLVFFFILSYIDLEILRKFSFLLVIVAAVLCLATFIPGIGIERNGASRWIKIGIWSYQPSEFVKFTLPFYLAHLLDKKSNNMDNFFSGVLPPVFVTGFFFAVIYAQNNFSTAVFIVFNALVIFFLAGMRYRHFFSALLMTIPISAILIFIEDHRVRRLVSFLKPEWDPRDAGLQVNASRDAIISSGFWGMGIGEGTRKIASIPEIHSDFIFSSYVEETGFLGIILFFALLAFFAVLGYRTAWRSKSVFNRLLAAGLTTMIVSQALLNVAVVSGALPATGIPLPFFSAGGSSIVTTLICAGFIINVARKVSANNAINGLEDEDE